MFMWWLTLMVLLMTKFPAFCGTLMIYYHLIKSPQLDPNLTPNLIKIHFNSIPPAMSRSPTWFLPSRFPD